MSDGRAREAAFSEADHRELNERLAEHDEAAGLGRMTLDFVCECDRDGCRRRVHMSADRWRELHRDGRTFVIAPAHNAEAWIDEVLERHDDYWLVRKIGEAGELAERLSDG